MELIGIAASTIAVVSQFARVVNHDPITVSGDIVASFTDLQAESVRRIQSEIIKLRLERLSRQRAPEVLPLESEDLLSNKLGEALHRYG